MKEIKSIKKNNRKKKKTKINQVVAISTRMAKGGNGQKEVPDVA